MCRKIKTRIFNYLFPPSLRMNTPVSLPPEREPPSFQRLPPQSTCCWAESRGLGSGLVVSWRRPEWPFKSGQWRKNINLRMTEWAFQDQSESTSWSYCEERTKYLSLLGLKAPHPSAIVPQYDGHPLCSWTPGLSTVMSDFFHNI